MAIAGDVELALAITDFIEEQLATVELAANLLQLVETTFGPFNSTRPVQLLIVQGTHEGKTLITRWDNSQGRYDVSECAHIGSLDPEQANRMADLFRRLVAEQQPSKRAMLMAGIAFVQSLSKHHDLIGSHVGGIVCGLRVERARAIWPGDIVIVHHRDDLASIDGRISLHAREGTVCINSTYHGSTGTILINKHASIRSEGIMKAWRARWLPHLKNYLSKHFKTCTRWVFINLERETPVVFVVLGKPESAGRQLRIKRKSDGSHKLTVDADLAEILRRPASSDGPELRILEVI